MKAQGRSREGIRKARRVKPVARSAQMMCPSCREWRMTGCAKGLPLWPRGGPGWCPGFEYEPGCHPSEWEPGEYERLCQ